MENIKVSVIIPVYNVENYLDQCLDSIIGQSLEDIEIICVNDGSTDNSLKILENYAKKDKRIRIINKKNAGLGAARNTGLNYAQGKYVSFIDSDDWIDLKMYECLLNSSEKNDADMIMFKMINYNEDSDELYETDYYNFKCINKFFNSQIFDYSDVKHQLFNISVSACTKLYKKSFLDNINAKFPEGLIFEDNPFFIEVFLNAKKILLFDKHLYFRRRRENSILSSINRKFFDIIPITDSLINIFKSNNLYNQFKKDLLNFNLSTIRNKYNLMDEVHKKEFFNIMKEYFLNVNNNKLLNNDFRENLNNTNLTFYLNILTAFTNSEFKLLNENEDLKIKNRKLKNENRKLKNENKKLKNENKKINNNIKELFSSTSWKITKPIRLIGKKFR